MNILGIETSCDETGICLIEATGSFPDSFRFKILGNALYSQVAIHAPYGGVFPNLAKREHAKNLVPLLKQVLEQSFQVPAASCQEKSANLDSAGSSKLEAGSLSSLLSREPELLEQLERFLRTYKKPNIDCIAVTHGPGLEPALWVGVNFARALAIIWNLPLVAVNHMEGHVVMSMMQENKFADFEFPLLSLLISGGHTELVLSKSWPPSHKASAGETMGYELLGATRDDAVGEAFDKVARLLDLPYPGGPEISRLAREARIEGRSFDEEKTKDGPSAIKFTPPMMHSKDYDFSFSGLKTEVRKFVEQNAPLSDDMKQQIALAFENAVAEVLVAKTMKAAEEFGARAILVGGGVSANAYIRERLKLAIEKEDPSIKLLIPPPELATDNALMIALAGYFHAQKQDFADPQTLKASGNLKLA